MNRRFFNIFILAVASATLFACNQANEVKQPWTFQGKIPMEGEMVYVN